ncbi:MAG: type II secretion system protein M [Nevskiaceae bacterium]|jgi:general secretion pathway protein M|nr:type II secretion system protein M [Nevskiaceae bacterium]
MNITALQDWYSAREPREQLILRWGAVAAVVLLILALALPVQRNVRAAQTRIETKQQDLAFLRQVGPTISAAGPMAPPPDSQQSLIVLVDSSARESGLGETVSGSQPSGDGGLRVQLEQADFNLLVAWLARLSTQHGLRIESANIESGSQPGLTNASVVIHLQR